MRTPRALVLLALSFGPAVLAARQPAAYPFLLASTLSGDGDVGAALDALDEAIRLAPDDAYIRLAHAELLAQVGRFDEALAEISAARHLAPQEASVHRLEARVSMQRLDRDPAARANAAAAFERWLASEPEDLEALVTLAQLHLGDGRAEEAVPLLERAAALRPGQPMIEGLRGRALAQAGSPSRAEEVQRELLRLHPDRLEVRFELAELLSTTGRPRAAVEVLSQAPVEQTGSPELRRRRAVAHLLAGELAAARGFARELFGEFPENSSVRLLLASIERADGRWADVVDLLLPLAARPQAPDSLVAQLVEALERLRRVEPALALLDQRAAALLAAGRVDEAASSALQAVDLALRTGRIEEGERRAAALAATPPAAESEAARARSIQLAWLRADSAAARGDWQGARSALLGLSIPAARARQYEIALRLGDEASAIALRRGLERGGRDERLALAESEARLERHGEAVALYLDLKALDPESTRIRFGLAASLERSGRGSEAELELETLLARSPDHPPALNYLGYLWIESARRLERAVEMIERAVRADPTNGAYVDSLGWGLYQLGRSAEAAEVLERAARLEENDPTILEHLGDAWAAAGDLARARAAYERALAVSQRGDELQAKIARIARPGGAS